MQSLLTWVAENWAVLAAAFFGSGVATAIANGWIANSAKKREVKRRVKFLRVELAFMFERYALEANQRISDYAFELYGEPNLDAVTMGIPSFSSLPESDEYKHLPVKLYNKIQEFMDWVQWRQAEVSFRHEAEGRFSGSDTARAYSAELGLTALEIADELRTFKLMKPRPLKFGNFSLRDSLKKELKVPSETS